MKRLSRACRWTALVLSSTLYAGGGCLPDNFFADKSAEIVNRSIFALINFALEPSGIAL